MNLSQRDKPHEKWHVVGERLSNTEPWRLPLIAQAVTSEFLLAQSASSSDHKLDLYAEFAKKFALLGGLTSDPVTKELCAINRFLALSCLYKLQPNSDISSDILILISQTELSVLPSRPRIIFATAISNFMCRYAERFDRLELVHDSVRRLKTLLADATTASEVEQLACGIIEAILLIFEYTSSQHFLNEIEAFNRMNLPSFRARCPFRKCGIFGLKYLYMVGVALRLRYETIGDIIELKKALAYTGFSYRRLINSAVPESAAVYYGVSTRVMYEATGEMPYLIRSRDAFYAGLGERVSEPENLDDGALTNFATTLWKLGLASADDNLLWKAYSYYRIAISKRGTYSVRNVPRMTNVLGVLSDLGRTKIERRLSPAEQRDIFSLVTWYDVVALTSRSHQMKPYAEASDRFQKETMDGKPAKAQLEAIVTALINMVQSFPRGVDEVVTRLISSLSGPITSSLEFRRLVTIGLEAKLRIILVDSVGAISIVDPARDAGLSKMDTGLFNTTRGSAVFAMGLLREWGAARCVGTLGLMFALFYKVQAWLLAIREQSQSAVPQQEEIKRLHAAAALAHRALHLDPGAAPVELEGHAGREGVFAAFRDELARCGGGNLLMSVSDESGEKLSDGGSPVAGDLWFALICCRKADEDLLVAPMVFRQRDGSIIEKVIWGNDVSPDSANWRTFEAQISLIADEIVQVAIATNVRPIAMAVAGDLGPVASFWSAFDHLCNLAIKRGVVISVGIANADSIKRRPSNDQRSVYLYRSDIESDTVLGRYFEACLRSLAKDHQVDLVVTGSLQEAFQAGSGGTLINYGHGEGVDDLSLRGGLLSDAGLLDGDRFLTAVNTEKLPQDVLLLSCSAGFLYRFDTAAAVGGFVTALMASGSRRIAAAGRPIDEARAFLFGLYFFQERFGEGKPFERAIGDAGQRVMNLDKAGFASEFSHWMSMASTALFKQAWDARLDASRKEEQREEAFSLRSYVLVDLEKSSLLKAN